MAFRTSGGEDFYPLSQMGPGVPSAPQQHPMPIGYTPRIPPYTPGVTPSHGTPTYGTPIPGVPGHEWIQPLYTPAPSPQAPAPAHGPAVTVYEAPFPAPSADEWFIPLHTPQGMGTGIPSGPQGEAYFVPLDVLKSIGIVEFPRRHPWDIQEGPRVPEDIKRIGPEPGEEVVNDFEKDKKDIMNEIEHTLNTMRSTDFSSFDEYVTAVKNTIKVYEEIIKNNASQKRKELDELLENEDIDPFEHECDVDSLNDLFEKNLAKLKDLGIQTIIAEFAKLFGDKSGNEENNFNYAVESYKNLNLPGFNTPKLNRCPNENHNDPDPSKVVHTPDGKKLACKPFKNESNSQCPELESPRVPFNEASKVLSNIIDSLHSCKMPANDWKIDCIRWATLCWILGGFAYDGEDFINRYRKANEKRDRKVDDIVAGPFTGRGKEDTLVWPQKKKDLDLPRNEEPPAKGSILWFGQTAGIYLGNGKYAVPCGQGEYRGVPNGHIFIGSEAQASEVVVPRLGGVTHVPCTE